MRGQLGPSLDVAQHQKLHGLVAELRPQLGLGFQLRRDRFANQLQALTAPVGNLGRGDKLRLLQ